MQIAIHGHPGEAGAPNPESPAFQKAQNACQKLLPGPTRARGRAGGRRRRQGRAARKAAQASRPAAEPWAPRPSTDHGRRAPQAHAPRAHDRPRDGAVRRRRRRRATRAPRRAQAPRWLAGARCAVAVAVVAIVRARERARQGTTARTPACRPARRPRRSRAARSRKARPSTARSATARRSNCTTASRGTFTWLPSVGAVVGRGGTLWRVNNLPVVLMYGSVPAYRTLKEGVSDGPDVTQLNENLIDLGYDPYGAITDDEDSAKPPPPPCAAGRRPRGSRKRGEVELGRVVFAPGARRVTAVKVDARPGPAGRGRRRRTGSTKPPPMCPTKSRARANRRREKGGEAKRPAKAKAAKERQGKEPAEEPNDKPRAKNQPTKKRPRRPPTKAKATAKTGWRSEGASGAGRSC